MNMVLSKVSLATAAAITVAALLTTVVGATTTINYDGHNGNGHHNMGSAYLKNKTLLEFGKYTNQGSFSGEAEVEDNTTVGNVATGNASSSNATALTVAVDNTGSSLAALNAGMSSSSKTMSESSSSTNSSSSASGGPSGSSTTSSSANQNSMNSNEEWMSQNTTVKNTTKAYIEEVTNQTAASGDIEVEDNTTVGNVTTGNATSTNTSSVIFTVAN